MNDSSNTHKNHSNDEYDVREEASCACVLSLLVMTSPYNLERAANHLRHFHALNPGDLTMIFHGLIAVTGAVPTRVLVDAGAKACPDNNPWLQCQPALCWHSTSHCNQAMHDIMTAYLRKSDIAVPDIAN